MCFSSKQQIDNKSASKTRSLNHKIFFLEKVKKSNRNKSHWARKLQNSFESLNKSPWAHLGVDFYAQNAEFTVYARHLVVLATAGLAWINEQSACISSEKNDTFNRIPRKWKTRGITGTLLVNNWTWWTKMPFSVIILINSLNLSYNDLLN